MLKSATGRRHNARMPTIVFHDDAGEAVKRDQLIKMLRRNLQDHLQARLVFKCNSPALNNGVRSIADKARIALQYALFRSDGDEGELRRWLSEDRRSSGEPRHSV